jgi:hypothetical protein
VFKLGSWGRRTEEQQKKEPEKDPSMLEDVAHEDKMVDYVSSLVDQGSASPSASVRSILKAAISSAEQIVESLRRQAEDEAARIIAQAMKEAEELRKGAAASQGVVQRVSTAGEPKQEKAEELAKGDGETAAALVQEREEPVNKNGAESTPKEREEPAEVAGAGKSQEAPVEAEKAEREEKESASVRQSAQSLYGGEVEIVVGVPVDPNVVIKLYGYLQSTPQIKFVRTSGSWNKGTSITVALDKPIPLVGELSSRIPEAVITGGTTEMAYPRGKKKVSIIDISLRK